MILTWFAETKVAKRALSEDLKVLEKTMKTFDMSPAILDEALDVWFIQRVFTNDAWQYEIYE